MEIKPQEIKDFLHMYIGQQFVIKINNTMSPDHGKYTSPMIFDANSLCAANSKKDRINPILILRKLSDMTEEECDKYGIAYLNGEYTKDCFEADATYGTTFKVYGIKSLSERVIQMCKDGWDVFGLIPAGLAIDKQTIRIKS